MKTILFVDDNKHIREFCRRELEEDGYRVVTARDGGEAMGLMHRQVFDVVVLDVCMPTADGLETIEKIRAVDLQVPVIFFTAYDEDCAKDCRGRFAAACVEKSEDLTELKRAVCRALLTPQHEQPLRLGLPPTGLP